MTEIEDQKESERLTGTEVVNPINQTQFTETLITDTSRLHEVSHLEPYVEKDSQIDGGKEARDKKKRNQLLILLLAIVGVIVVACIVTLAVLMSNGGGDDPVSPDDPVDPGDFKISTPNTYMLSSTEPTTEMFNGVEYTLERDTSDDLDATSAVPETDTNKYIDQVTMRAYSLAYSTLRLMFFDSSSPPESSWIDQQFLSESYMAEYYNGLKYIQQLEITSSESTQSAWSGLKSDSHSNFQFTLKSQTQDEELLNNKNAPFVMMTQYQQIGFNVDSQSIFGIGERFSNLKLKEGNYTLYPYYNGYVVDEGEGGQEQYGQHPLVVIQTHAGSFFGIFLFNTNAQTFSLKFGDGETSQLSFTTIGGFLDLMVLTGPDYRTLVMQYQQIVGKPKRAPYWANGFFTRSHSFDSVNNIGMALTAFQTNNMPLDGWSLPLTALTNMENFNYKVDLTSLTDAYPTLYLIHPFTYLITAEDDQETLLSNNLAVTIDSVVEGDDEDIDNSPVGITVMATEGYCLDPFHPGLRTLFLQPQFDLIDPLGNGMWLEQNVPLVDQVSDVPDREIEVNPYYDLPYIPGLENKNGLGYKTLPMSAKHVTPDNNSAYHFDLHSMFGTEFARHVQKALSKSASSSSTSDQSFVISDSTFPGAGQLGIGHVLPRNKPSWEDLTYQLALMVDFHLFGIQNVGPNLAGYYTTDDDTLYAAYFQLAVVSPLAVFNDNSTTTASQPSMQSEDTITQVRKYLRERMVMFNYMRTQLYLNEKYGGVLLRPAFFDYPQEKYWDYDLNDMSQQMFGCCIMAIFQTEENKDYVDVVFPLAEDSDGGWLELQSMTYYYFPSTSRNHVIVPVGEGFPVPTFQKMGTIVAIQSSIVADSETDEYYTQIQDLFDVPIQISIVYDKNGQAEGYILLESQDTSGQEEFYFLKSVGNIINVKQQNSGEVSSTQGNHAIESIELANIKSSEGVAQACAILNDMQTVQTLQVSERFEDTNQAEIKPLDGEELILGDIAFIFYGTIKDDFNDNVCDANLFTLSLTEEIQNDEQHFIATLYQNVYKLIPEDGYQNIYLNISLITENVLYVNLNHSQSPVDAIIDRNFSGYQSIASQYKITDVLDIMIDENVFYMTIKDLSTDQPVVMTTENALIFFGQNLCITNLFFPTSNPSRFFGLGERKGPFFLEDQNWYALYSSNKRLDNQVHSNGKFMQLGMSGYMPHLYGQYEVENTNYYIGMSLLQEGGGDFIYFTGESSPTVQTPQFTMLSSYPQDFLIAFHEDLKGASLNTLNLVMMGDMIEADLFPIIPPPAWMFGTYMDVQSYIEQPEDLDMIIDYYTNELGWPLEGFLMHYESLEGYESLTFNSTTYPDAAATFQDLESRGFTVINIMQPGINIYSENEADQNLIEAGGVIMDESGTEPLVGQDQSGTVYYADYSNENSAQFLKDSIDNYASTYGLSRLPIKYKKNEITNQYCHGDCLKQNLIQQVRDQLYRPGTIDMLQNLLAGDNQRAIGNVEQTQNMNGLMTQIQLANAFEKRWNYPMISDSLMSYSYQIGNVGHVTDYIHFTKYDADNAASIIQSLSVLGITNIGMELHVQYDPEASADGLKEFRYTFETLLKLQAFCPLSISSLVLPPQLESISTEFLDLYKTLAKVRYSLMPYLRTRLQQRSRFGYSYIAPIFYQFPNDDSVYDYVATEFMVGPALLVSTAYPDDDRLVDMYFPDGNWCTVLNKYSTSTTCITIYDKEQPTDKQSNFVFLKDGTILPMQDTSDGIVNSFDLEDLYIDVHVSMSLKSYDEDDGDLRSEGLLFLDSADPDTPEDFCFTYFNYDNAQLQVNEINPDQDNKKLCVTDPPLKNQMLGRVYFYDPVGFGLDFEHADLNPDSQSGFSPETFNVVVPEGDNPGFIYFDFSSFNIPIRWVGNIDFYADLPTNE